MGGGSLDRPELEKCLDRLSLVVWRLDRLDRSIRELLQLVDRLDKSGINFISLKISSTPVPPQAGLSSTSLQPYAV